MLLILSDEDDLSTNEVIDWLRYYSIPWFRISAASELHVSQLEITGTGIQFTLEIKEPRQPSPTVLIHSSSISGYWYRRGDLRLAEYTIHSLPGADPVIARVIENICRHIKQENAKITQLLHLYFKSLKHIGSYFENHTNKLHNLFLASQLGISVPASLITCRKGEFLAFQNKTGACVVKAVDRAGFQAGPGIGLGATTSLADENVLVDMPDTFGYTLFQEFIDKAYDLRVFYINGAFFSSAILSQSNAQTRIDFRNYDSKRPNRIVPYQLPSALENKLHSLMGKLGLKSGSIDLVRGKQNEFFFLEINPIGQYGFAGARCNYYLDKHIARYYLQTNKPYARSTQAFS